MNSMLTSSLTKEHGVKDAIDYLHQRNKCKKKTNPPFQSRGWSVTNWRKRVLNSWRMSRGVSKLTMTCVLTKKTTSQNRTMKDELTEEDIGKNQDRRTTSHMGPLRRTLRMCFLPKRTELGATITCPSTRWKVVEKSPNSNTNIGESSVMMKARASRQSIRPHRHLDFGDQGSLARKFSPIRIKSPTSYG